MTGTLQSPWVGGHQSNPPSFFFSEAVMVVVCEVPITQQERQDLILRGQIPCQDTNAIESLFSEEAGK